MGFRLRNKKMVSYRWAFVWRKTHARTYAGRRRFFLVVSDMSPCMQIDWLPTEGCVCWRQRLFAQGAVGSCPRPRWGRFSCAVLDDIYPIMVA